MAQGDPIAAESSRAKGILWRGCLLLPLRFGIFGVMLAGPIADFIAFVVSTILVCREFKRLKEQERLLQT